jgi:hypothetical protein
MIHVFGVLRVLKIQGFFEKLAWPGPFKIPGHICIFDSTVMRKWVCSMKETPRRRITVASSLIEISTKQPGKEFLTSPTTAPFYSRLLYRYKDDLKGFSSSSDFCCFNNCCPNIYTTIQPFLTTPTVQTFIGNVHLHILYIPMPHAGNYNKKA